MTFIAINPLLRQKTYIADYDSVLVCFLSVLALKRVDDEYGWKGLEKYTKVARFMVTFNAVEQSRVRQKKS